MWKDDVWLLLVLFLWRSLTYTRPSGPQDFKSSVTYTTGTPPEPELHPWLLLNQSRKEAGNEQNGPPRAPVGPRHLLAIVVCFSAL